MATTISGSSAQNGYGFYIVLTETVNKNNNTSDIAWDLRITNSSKRFNSGGWAIKVNINGTSVCNLTNQTINSTVVSANASFSIKSGTLKSVAHNDDGKKTISVTASLTKSSPGSYDPGNCSLSGNMVLTAIPRDFSKAPILAVAKGADEHSLVCTWTTSENCSAVKYKKGSEATWTSAPDPTGIGGTTGQFTLTGLTAGTEYSIQIECTRKDSSRPSVSTAVKNTTYPYPTVTAVTDANGTSLVGTNKWNMAGVTSKGIKVTIDNPLKRTVAVYIEVGGNTKTKTDFTMTKSSDTLYTYTLTKEALNKKITTATSADVSYWLVYDSNKKSSLVGTYELIESECKPTIGTVTWKELNTIVKNIVNPDGKNNKLVQNKSELGINISSITKAYDSRIKIIEIYDKTEKIEEIKGVNEVAAVIGKDINLGNCNYVGSQSFKIVVIDERDWSSSTQITGIEFLEYQPPVLSATASRDGGYGEKATLVITASYSSLGGKNSWNNDNENYIKYSVDSSTTKTKVGIPGQTFNKDTFAITPDLSNDSSHEIKVYSSDKLTVVEDPLIITIGKGVPILTVLKNPTAVGVNCVPTQSGLHVEGNSSISGNLSVGNLKIKTTNYTSDIITGHDAGVNGQNITMQSGGNLIIGSGEFSNNLYSAAADSCTGTGEVLYLGSDNQVYVYSNGQTIANRKRFTFDNDGYFNAPTGIKINDTNIFLKAYPVGSIYMSTNSTSPAELFGGTWASLEGRFLLGANSEYAAGATGGQKEQAHTHNYKLAYRMYYGALAGGDTDAIRVWNYSNSTWKTAGTKLTQETGVIPNITGDKSANAAKTEIEGTTSSTTINTLPPYLSVYMWKRTA